MLNLELISDRIARVKVEQRRNNEAERKKIIFNDKKGVGVSFRPESSAEHSRKRCKDNSVRNIICVVVDF